ncbi:hypothetical protein HJG60_011296 [Phyllostomus discolor]|uniref:Uncharacterized protein n=1 Tax=Phyllostomus discolor TaxID=89673 RepID=A0A834A4A6_9CHIR|nr:hypothetical protein HJG60_011296 [Phyllostomus discolor]
MRRLRKGKNMFLSAIFTSSQELFPPCSSPNSGFQKKPVLVLMLENDPLKNPVRSHLLSLSNYLSLLAFLLKLPFIFHLGSLSHLPCFIWESGFRLFKIGTRKHFFCFFLFLPLIIIFSSMPKTKDI